jgi:hypothetical protein
MNQQHYLPLELSKLVSAKVPTLNTGMWHNKYFSHPIESEQTPYTLIENCRAANGIPAYRLDDLTRALVIYGENDESSMQLAGAFLADNLRLDVAGGEVEKFINNTFV